MTKTDRAPVSHCWDDVIGEDERLIASFYERPWTFAGPAALIMIDLYNKAYGDAPLPLAAAVERFPSSCGLAGWAALDATVALLEASRRAGMPVVFTTAAQPVHGLGGATRRVGIEPPRAWDTEIVDALKPAGEDYLLVKSRASAFFGTPLDTWLRRLDVKTVVIAGEATSGCVRATAVDAYSLGFDVVVAEDAVFDRSALSHKSSLFDLHLKYAAVVRNDDLLKSIEESNSSLSGVT